MSTQSVIIIFGCGIILIWSTFLWKQVHMEGVRAYKEIIAVRLTLEQSERQWFSSYNALKKKIEDLEGEIGSFSAIHDKD